MTSPNADCASCKPEPHPFRRHHNGICQVQHCPCTDFVELQPAAAPQRCYICDRPAHATGFCPYVKKPIR